MITVLERGSLDQDGSAGPDKEDDFIFNSDINYWFFSIIVLLRELLAT